MTMTKEEVISMIISKFEDKGYDAVPSKRWGDKLVRMKFCTWIAEQKSEQLFEFMFYMNYKGQYGIYMVPTKREIEMRNNDTSDAWRWKYITTKMLKIPLKAFDITTDSPFRYFADFAMVVDCNKKYGIMEDGNGDFQKFREIVFDSHRDYGEKQRIPAIGVKFYEDLNYTIDDVLKIVTEMIHLMNAVDEV